VATALVLANFALTVTKSAGQPDAYRPGASAVCLTLLGVLLAWCVAESTRARPRRAAMRVLVSAAYLMLATHPLILTRDLPSPPLLHALGAAMHVTAVGWGTRAAWWAVPGFAAAVIAIRAPALGTGRALTEGGLLLLTGLITTAVVHVLRRALERADGAVAAAGRAQEMAARAARRAFEEIRWDAITHDLVLGALLGAGRAGGGHVPEGARQLARDAMTALAGPGRAREQDISARAHRSARLLGLSLDLDLRGDLLDAEVTEIVSDAVDQALSNIARHSGVTQATVRGVLGARHATVTVTDHGRGFAVPTPRRSGLSTTAARLRSIGGTAHVRSAVGQGTTVTLTWNAPLTAAAPSRAEWTMTTFAPLMVLGAIAVGLNIALGARHWQVSPWPWASALVLLGVVLTTIAASLLSPGSPGQPAVVASLVLLPGLAAATGALGAPTDWRYWYLGALTPAIGATAFRCRPAAGGAAGVGAGLLVSVVDSIRGFPWFACWVGPMPVLLITALAGWALRRSLERAWDQVTRSSLAAHRSRLEAVEDEERQTAAARRTAALRALTAAALTRIADGTVSSTTERAELLIVEASVRDALVAPSLVDPVMQGTLAAARRRGAAVMIEGSDVGPGTDDDSVLPTLRLVVAIVLEQASPGSTTTIHWGDPDEPGGFTLAYAAAGAPAVVPPRALAEALNAAITRLGADTFLAVSSDSLAVLVESGRPPTSGSD
jgi:hypothetical protein